MLTTAITVDPRAYDRERVGFFRYGRVADKVLITNEASEHLILTEPQFQAFYRGKINEGDPLYPELQRRGFVREGVDLDGLAGRIRRKKAFLKHAPHLHVFIVTLRCNQACKYCHASRADMDAVDTDMSVENAKKAVDFIFSTPAPVLNIEFQGGEPTANFPVIQFVVDYAREKNRYEERELIFSMVTNMTLMTEERMNWLIDRGVMVCTSLDGPADVHDQNRPFTGSKTAVFDHVVSWMDRFNAAYVARGLDPDFFHVDALMTTTRASLTRGRDIVDLYLSRGLRSIHLRPLNPFGFAVNTWKQIGYTMEEFLQFYRDTAAYILEKNRGGTFLQERMASVFLTRMLTPDDPNYTDCRSPVGSGMATLAYNYDGGIYTCDEGRMAAHMGNETFRLGHVAQSTWDEVRAHPTIRALAVASINDALPACVGCAYKPSCGIQPLHNYMFDGDLFGQRPRSRKCQEFHGVQTWLYERLAADADGSDERIFRRWTIQRSRPGTVPYPPVGAEASP